MTFTIGQAIYGERDRGHRLLAASSAFPDAEQLAGRMDMQGSPPPHTVWEPYLSGFPWKDHYILARTMVDPQATRAGMVFSRALALPKQCAADWRDIGGLISFLTERSDSRVEIDDLTPRPGRAALPGHPGLVQALLLDASATVVWPGQDGFAEAVAALWQALWPAARLAFNFRIAFSPTDVATDSPALVSTPVSLLSRWSGFTVVRLDAQPDKDDVAEAHLLRRAASSKLEDALQDFGPLTPKVLHLRQIVGMLDLARGGGTFADYVDGLRLACYLAPEEGVGAGLKASLLQNAICALDEASAKDVRMLRNLDLGPVASREVFWRSVAGWTKASLWRDRDAGTVATVIDEAHSNKPLARWREAIIAGIRQSLSPPTGELSQALWRTMAARPSLLATLSQKGTGNLRSLEAALLFKLPKSLNAKAAETLAATALTLKVPTLHAACCTLSLPPVEAIAQHLAVAEATIQSLDIAAAKAGSAERLTAALMDEGELTLALAADAAIRAPSILRKIDVRNARWRAVWTLALQIDQSIVERQPRVVQTLTDLFDMMIDTGQDVAALLDPISRTALADLSGYARRAEIWTLLPSATLAAFLQATADGWLARIEAGADEICEDVLARVVAEPHRLDPAMKRLVHHVLEGCHLFRALPGLNERAFQTWFRSVLDRGHSLSPQEADAIGRLIAARDWSDGAKALTDGITDAGRNDLRPAIDYVVEMVGMIRRYLLDESGSRTPELARWRILEEIALELYGYGPGDQSLWQRAGGKERDIPKTDTGAQSWRKVLDEAQKGRGSISVATLLKTMSGDYPHNRTLRKLVSDSAFGGR